MKKHCFNILKINQRIGSQNNSFHQNKFIFAKDLYSILGVSKNATSSEIKKEYFKKAKKYHPDVNKEKNAKEKFAEIQQAYETLKDDKKRQMYDTTGQVDDQGGQYANYEDIFEQFFGGKRGQAGGGGFGGNGFPGGGFQGGGFPGGGFDQESGNQRTERKRGVDVHLQDFVTLKEAIYGSKKDVSYRVEKKCDSCSGSGKIKSQESKCHVCNGTGASSAGFFNMACQNCGGKGKVSPNCQSCDGKGTQMKTSELSVTTPKFLKDGQVLKGKGKGHAGLNGGPNGDLFLTLKIHNDALFQRNGNVIESKVNINLFQAILGSEVKVRGLNRAEEKTIKIPPKSQNGDYQKEFFEGVEHHFFFNITMPTYWSEEHLNLIRQIGYQSGEKF
eukprot:gene849-9098_t